MVDLNNLISKIANQKTYESKEMQEACQKTLKDYESLDVLDDGSAAPLRMIAWDKKCSN